VRERGLHVEGRPEPGRGHHHYHLLIYLPTRFLVYSLTIFVFGASSYVAGGPDDRWGGSYSWVACRQSLTLFPVGVGIR